MKRWLLRLLPNGLTARIREVSGLEGPARRIYVRLWFSRTLGFRRPRTTLTQPATAMILFVCHGNIMRSPAAAAMFHQQVGTRHAPRVRSAGVDAVEGRPADPRAVKEALNFGVSLTSHRAQPLTSDLVGNADLIVVMDLLNEAHLLARYPTAAHKVVLLGAFTGGRALSDLIIPDPYSGDAETIQRCFSQVAQAVRALHSALGPGDPQLDQREG